MIDTLDFRTGVEVGVMCGYYSLELLKFTNTKMLYGIDPWLNQDHYQEAVRLLRPFGDRSRLITGYSVEVAENFEDGSLDYVFLDGAHDYANVKLDLAAWFPKVRRGGLFYGHDYDWTDVRKAVDEWTASVRQEVRVLGTASLDLKEKLRWTQLRFGTISPSPEEARMMSRFMDPVPADTTWWCLKDVFCGNVPDPEPSEIYNRLMLREPVVPFRFETRRFQYESLDPLLF